MRVKATSGISLPDFLRDGEVVLAFDDGPWSGNTPVVLKALAAQCTKAVSFPIGKHAMWHPEILKQVRSGPYHRRAYLVAPRSIEAASRSGRRFQNPQARSIVLMHDFQHATALALPELLVALRAGGYRVVQVKTKEPVTTLAAYDQQLEKN
jgi:peptidoglycan/xylan/chitin deacetylase (PgdA/CDA1 family)